MSFQTSITIKDELEIALEAASMENKILIISIVNNAYAKEGSILDLFLHSFKVGQDTQMLLNHLLLVAVDQIAFDRCNLLHLHCYKLVTDGVDFSREKTYMSQDFIKMMWTRTLFLADVLRRGYSFIFTVSKLKNSITYTHKRVIFYWWIFLGVLCEATTRATTNQED